MGGEEGTRSGGEEAEEEEEAEAAEEAEEAAEEAEEEVWRTRCRPAASP